MSNKRPLAWHKANLKNHGFYLNAKRRDFLRIEDELKRSEQSFRFAANQIAEAERRGLDSFDAERFLVSRKTKIPTT